MDENINKKYYWWEYKLMKHFYKVIYQHLKYTHISLSNPFPSFYLNCKVLFEIVFCKLD